MLDIVMKDNRWEEAEEYCRSLYEKYRSYGEQLQSILLKNKKKDLLKSDKEIVYRTETRTLDSKVLEKSFPLLIAFYCNCTMM